MSACALVVDDDRLLLRLVEMNLGKTGMRVLLADSGEDALRLAAEEKPDVILLDIMMPFMDGYEVMGRLKADGATQDIPVIMLTAKSSHSDMRKCEEMGAAAYITKPFNLDDLRSTVSRVLQQSSGPRASCE
jgi:DNA-binding response OmpR family regulator